MSDASINTATLTRAIERIVDARLRDLHTAMPGLVVDFDADTQLASVQPAIRRQMLTNDGEKDILIPSSIPQLINVPIVFPQGGGYHLTIPVSPGDEVLLIFCERSIDQWHEFGTEQVPAIKRFHAYADAFAIPGINSKPKKVADYQPDRMELRDDLRLNYVSLHATGIEIASIGTVEIGAIGGLTFTTAATFNGQINATSGMQVTGSMTNNGVNVGSTHTHPQGNDSNGDAQQNTGAPL